MTDSRRKRVLIVLAISSVVLVWRVVAVVTDSAPVESAAAPVQPDLSPPTDHTAPDDDAQSGSVMSKEETRSVAIAVASALEQPWGRNPFVGPIVHPKKTARAGSKTPPPSAAPAPAYVLRAVSRRDRRWCAIFAGEIVTVGDVVADEFQIMGIDRHSLTLLRAGWSYRYEIGAEIPVIELVGEGTSP